MRASPAAIEDALPPVLKSGRVISAAMAGGVIMLAGVVVAIAVSAPPERHPDLGVLEILTGITLLLTPVLWALAPWLARRVLEAGLAREGVASDPAGFVRLALSAQIIRLALREAPALLGLVVCLMASTDGVLFSQRWLAVNALPALVFVLHTLATLPTGDALRSDLRI